MASHATGMVLRAALLEIMGYFRGHGREQTVMRRLPDAERDEVEISCWLSRIGREKKGDRVQIAEIPAGDTIIASAARQGRGTENVPAPGLRSKQEKAGLHSTVPAGIPPRKEPSPEEEAQKALEAYVAMIAERQVHLVKLFMILYEAETEITKLIAEAAAKRAKVTDKMADRWASVLGGGSD